MGRVDLVDLVHEGLQPGAGVGLLLPVVRKIEEGDVFMIFAKPLEQGIDDGPRHAGEGHDVDQAADPFQVKVLGLAHTEDGLPFEGGMEVRVGVF